MPKRAESVTTLQQVKTMSGRLVMSVQVTAATSEAKVVVCY